MANKLIEFASHYLKNPNALTLVENKTINPEVLVSNFCIHNTAKFLNQLQEKDVRDYVLYPKSFWKSNLGYLTFMFIVLLNY